MCVLLLIMPACAEAVFVGILMTQGWMQLQRLPLGFKSRGCDGQV
jgi:type III secretory pathway component EscS